MRGNFYFIFFTLKVLAFISCSDNTSSVQQGSFKEAFPFTDSTEIRQVHAIYQDADGYSFIIKNDTVSTAAKKMTYVPGFPLIIDTLTQTDAHTFKSFKFGTSYTINDSEVVSTYYQKIIHPSSNWQGQTPWRETIFTRHSRLDRKTK